MDPWSTTLIGQFFTYGGPFAALYIFEKILQWKRLVAETKSVQQVLEAQVIALKAHDERSARIEVDIADICKSLEPLPGTAQVVQVNRDTLTEIRMYLKLKGAKE